MKKLNVLSLFDGMSCGQIALDQLGIPIEKYYASELDKFAIKVTQHNYPHTIQLGDVTNWRDWKIDWSEIDLIYGGSPCQGFSFAGKQLAFDDPRSALFFVFVDIVNHIKSVNPNVKFLLENVRMKQEYLDIISEHIGVQPVKINSALVSAQNRVRYYWTNIEGVEQPKDRGILLKDILESNNKNTKLFNLSEKAINYIESSNPKWSNGKKRTEIYENKHNEKAHCITANYFKGVPYGITRCIQGAAIRGRYLPNGKIEQKLELNGKEKSNSITTVQKDSLVVNRCIQVGKADLKGHDQIKRVYSPKGKAPTLNANGGGNLEPKVIVPPNEWRKLTPLECERLQTLPDRYSLVPWQKRMMSNSQRYKMLGNGWTIEVIKHIFKNLHNT